MKTIATLYGQMIAVGVLMLPLFTTMAAPTPALAQIGQRFPSEKKTVNDSVTGVLLSFLTSSSIGDRKMYQTHPQWTADGKWVIFQSNRAEGQAFAVNEASGDIVQVTENGFTGMLCVAQKSMRLIHLRPVKTLPAAVTSLTSNSQAITSQTGTLASNTSPASTSVSSTSTTPAPQAFEVVSIDLAKVLADSEADRMKPATEYEHVFGTIPAGMATNHELALDADEESVYFRLTHEEAAQHLPAGTKIEPAFGVRNMGYGPTGIGSMNLKTGKVRVVAAVPFQVGHIQTNPWVAGEIVFAWETGGKAPQRTWTVKADGSELRPLYPEKPYDWVTHEAVITKDEVAIALLGHRKAGTDDAWGPSGAREHPTGLGIVNLRTGAFSIAGQTESGSGLWHVNGSPDGRWAVGDDFDRNIYLIDRHTKEMMLLSTGHKETADDHPHPSFSADGTRIEIQSAMLSPDGKTMDICVIPVPQDWLNRTYAD